MFQAKQNGMCKCRRQTKTWCSETKGEGMVGGIATDEARGGQEPGHAKAF